MEMCDVVQHASSMMDKQETAVLMCHTLNCSAHGKYVQRNGTCKCKEGYADKRCADVCITIDCGTHRTCQCDARYAGDRCVLIQCLL